ncbi:MAG TPA: caspase family protein [Pyrinomonadaceae bacterium]|nr:caspase family protein [Pyrinomonadaceae bacterium]
MRRSITILAAAFAVFFSSCLLAWRAAEGGDSAPPQAAGRKRALLAGLSAYCRGNDPEQCMAGKKWWWDLNSSPDVEALELTLKNKFGFDEVKVLRTKEEATHSNIVGTFRSFLIEQTGRNDIVYFHYSGHGTQVPDDRKHGPNADVGDEIDGLDESLVPSDYVTQGDGSNNIRDDEIRQLLAGLRARKPANVTLTFDSYFSGSTTRGGRSLVRGARWQGPAPAGRGTGGREDSPSGLFARGEADSQGYAALSATSHDQLANEDEDEVTGEQMGVLTYALVRALEKADGATNCRDVFECVNDTVTRRFRNQDPQIEGGEDSLLMSGIPVPPPPPYIEVKVSGGKVVLQAGRLQGMAAGSEFSIYGAGKDVRKSEPMAKAEIESPDLLTSALKIRTPEVNEKLLDDLRAARAVETAQVRRRPFESRHAQPRQRPGRRRGGQSD